MKVLTLESNLLRQPTRQPMLERSKDIAELVKLREHLDFAEKGVGLKDFLLGLFLVLEPHAMVTSHNVYRYLTDLAPERIWGISLVAIGMIRAIGTESQSFWLRTIGSFWGSCFWAAIAFDVYQVSGITLGFAAWTSLMGINIVIYLYRRDVLRRIKAMSKGC